MTTLETLVFKIDVILIVLVFATIVIVTGISLALHQLEKILDRLNDDPD